MPTHPLSINAIMFYQNLSACTLLSLFMLYNHGLWQSTKLLQTTKVMQHSVRVASAGVGVAIWYISLKLIPVTQVVALSFIAPIITTIGAVLFLKEDLNWRRRLAIALSLSGGFIISRPDLAIVGIKSFNWALLLPILAAIIFSYDKIITRQLLLAKETPMALTWFLLAFLAIFALAGVLLTESATALILATSHIPWLLLLGSLSIGSHYAFNKAYEDAELTLLLPFGAVKILLCAILSYIFFVEAPNSFNLWLGILVITSSTLILKDNNPWLTKIAKSVNRWQKGTQTNLPTT